MVKDNDKNIESILADDSFVRWIEQKASQKEIEKWEAWLSESTMHNDLANEAKRLHHSFRFRCNSRQDVVSELQRLNHSIDKLEGAGDRNKSLKLNNHFGRNRFILFAAAASLLVITLLGGLYFSYPENSSVEAEDSILITKSTPFGEKKRLTLADGSTV